MVQRDVLTLEMRKYQLETEGNLLPTRLLLMHNKRVAEKGLSLELLV